MKKSLLLIGSIFVILGGCKNEILHGLSEQEANEIVTFLRNSNIEAVKEPEGGTTTKEKLWKIKVPRYEITRALTLLYEYNLPREKGDNFSTVFSGSSLVPTPTEEKALFIRALTGELSKTIENIDGVIYAKVHFTMPENEGFSKEETEPPKASVLIKYIGEKPPYKVEDIQRLVAGAIPRLEPDKVTVIGVKREISPQLLNSLEQSVTIVGIKVSQSSKGTLQLILGLLIGLIIICTLIIIVLGLQLKKVRRYQFFKE